MAEWVEHHGEHYLRIDPQMVDFANAGTVHKVTDDFAVRVTKDMPNLPTITDGHVETFKDAHIGDWIVFNIGNVNTREIPGYADMTEDEKIFARIARVERYVLDDATFRDAHGELTPFANGVIAPPKGEPRPAMTLSFDAVFTGPWDGDEYVRAGGFIVKDGEKIYGIQQKPAQYTYGAIDQEKPFIETHAAKIMARTPLVPEVVFKPEIASVYSAALAARRSKED